VRRADGDDVQPRVELFRKTEKVELIAPVAVKQNQADRLSVDGLARRMLSIL
jgi:hypothetical protein